MAYTSAFDPFRMDLSDHDSDDELCEEIDCDTDEDENTRDILETVGESSAGADVGSVLH